MKYILCSALILTAAAAQAASLPYCKAKHSAAFVEMVQTAKDNGIKELTGKDLHVACLCYEDALKKKKDPTKVCLGGMASKSRENQMLEEQLAEERRSVIEHELSQDELDAEKLLRENQTRNAHDELINPTDGMTICTYPQESLFVMGQGWRCITPKH